MKNPFVYQPTSPDIFIPMPTGEKGNTADSEKTPASFSSSLDQNAQELLRLLHVPPNADIIQRDFVAGGRNGRLIIMEGMSSREEIALSILSPILRDKRLQDIQDDQLIDHIANKTLSSASLVVHTSPQEALRDILNGCCAVLFDRTNTIISVDLRMYEKRNVENSQVESVILGSHEGFTENLRTSISQVRRLLRTGKLVTEFFEVGDEAPTAVALLYLDGIVNPELVNEARRRLANVRLDFVPGSGYLQKLIEDSPTSFVPQMTQTERPDRTAFFLIEGHVAILCDGTPFGVIAPSTIWHLMHTPDDSYMRWLNGNFIRIIRFIGLFLALLLPALYLSTIMYHSEILPIELLVSIASANAKVPFPMLLEVLLMELSFDLIHEAGSRVPGALGNALGIIGAIVLGQAAVAAAIVSPILIIIVAVTGLGSFAIPDYSFSISVRILRILFILAAALLGYMGVCLLLFIMLVSFSTLSSFGVPWLSPFAPKSTANPDLIFNGNIWTMRRRPSNLRSPQPIRIKQRARAWDDPNKKL